MTQIIDIMLKERSCWINMTIPTQTIAFINEQFLIMVAIEEEEEEEEFY